MRSSQIWSMGFAILACAVGGTMAQATGPLAGLDELLDKQKNLTTFHSYLKLYPQILEDVKAGGGGITILAPDNTAMDKIPSTRLKGIFETKNATAIISLLKYYVMVGTERMSALTDGQLQVRATLFNDSQHTSLSGGQSVTYIKAYDGTVTFISGIGTRSTLLTADLPFSNGLVQVIDSPLIPPLPVDETTTQYNLTGFQGALITSDKLSALKNTKTVTIFAPRNAAFQALGPAISSLTAAQLSNVLSYHIINNQTVYSPSLKNGTVLTTETGQSIKISTFGNELFVNTAQVVEKDILIANGVIHILDAVLNPDNATNEPNPEVATQKPVFDGASVVPGVPFTTAIPCSTACSTTGTGAAAGATGAGGVKTSSSRALAMPRETGLGGSMGLAAAVVGGVVMML